MRFNLQEFVSSVQGLARPVLARSPWPVEAAVESGVSNLGKLVLIDGPERFEIDNAVMGVRLNKNIVETAIAGRDFMVNEIINASGWSLDIMAYLVSGDGSFPETMLTSLRKFCLKNKSLAVENDYLRMLGIHYIIINDLALPEAGGYVDALPYRINASSDHIVELLLKNEDGSIAR